MSAHFLKLYAMKKLLSLLSMIIIASAASAVAKQSNGVLKHKNSMQRLMNPNSPMPF